jgi:hypothetical protein
MVFNMLCSAIEVKENCEDGKNPDNRMWKMLCMASGIHFIILGERPIPNKEPERN